MKLRYPMGLVATFIITVTGNIWPNNQLVAYRAGRNAVHHRLAIHFLQLARAKHQPRLCCHNWTEPLRHSTVQPSRGETRLFPCKRL